jgi:outer membrane scaffolding protein for murein synthesis (MipA/OmpV family)
MRFVCRIILFMLVMPGVHAGGILDYIRNYDLNDYALGVSYSVSQRPYVGSENSSFAYPYLTSFRNNAFTDDWLILSNGDAGFRWTNEAGWVLGAVGRINTQGTGTESIQELLGMDDRQWTVEVAPLIGWRGWPVHLEFKQYYEIFSNHGGPSSEFRTSFPVEFPRGWFVPSAMLIHNSADRNRYYYGVSASEVRPGRPEYVPGSSNNLKLGVSIGFAITEKWLLSVSVGYEWLDSVISDSPIVDTDTLWSANIGIAYNNDIFRSREYTGDAFTRPGFELRAGIYSNNIDSTIVRRPVDNSPGEEVDMEDVLGIDRNRSVLQFDGVYRFAHFHRIEVGYFELGRESKKTLLTDITIGDETFLQGTEIDVDADLSVTRITYGFSLMNDSQKELGLLVGIHLANYDALVTSEQTGQRVESSIDTPLPVIGAFGSLSLGENTKLSTSVQVFRMEFDHYEGSLNALYLGLKHYFTEKVGAGIGYNYYAMNLDSPDERLRGSLRIRHHGPIVFASFNF